MKSSIFTITCLLLALCANAQPAGEPWMDLQVNEINRLPVHTSFFAYDDIVSALNHAYGNSGRYLSLDGDWKFQWVANLDERPTDFYRTDLDDSD